MTRYTLDDVGGALSWRALLHFVRGLPPTSHFACSVDPKLQAMSAWLDGSMVAPLLADLIDCINLERWEYAVSCVGKGKRKPRKPKPVPRPWVQSTSKGERHIGKDPIRIADFEVWWNSKSGDFEQSENKSMSKVSKDDLKGP